MDSDSSDNSTSSSNSEQFYDIEDEIVAAIHNNDILELYELVENNEFTDEDMEEYAEICVEDRNIECLDVLMEVYDYDKFFILCLAIEYGFFKLFKKYYDEETDKENCFVKLIDCMDDNITEEIKDGRMEIMEYL